MRISLLIARPPLSRLDHPSDEFKSTRETFYLLTVRSRRALSRALSRDRPSRPAALLRACGRSLNGIAGRLSSTPVGASLPGPILSRLFSGPAPHCRNLRSPGESNATTQIRQGVRSSTPTQPTTSSNQAGRGPPSGQLRAPRPGHHSAKAKPHRSCANTQHATATGSAMSAGRSRKSTPAEHGASRRRRF
jgi:hypothetical protein